MLENIFIVLGLIGFTDAMFGKFDVWAKIESFLVKVSQGKSKVLFALAFCMLCQTFWLIVILTVLVALVVGFSWFTLLVPFVVLGLFHLISKK